MNLRKMAVLLTTCAVLAGIAWNGYQLRPASNVQPLKLTGEGVEQLPDFSFPDVDGNKRDKSEWNGRVLVLNFWATWCPPCREEMPLFVELQKQYAGENVQFVSIAIDEPNLVRDFYDVYGINFPTLIGGMDAIKLANVLGNRFDSLPFTAIFDRTGKRHYIQAGQIDRETLQQQINTLLSQI